MPVPSTMMAFRETHVWMPKGLVISVTAFIMGTGPMART